MLHMWAIFGLNIHQHYTGLNITTKPKYSLNDLIHLTQAQPQFTPFPVGRCLFGPGVMILSIKFTGSENGINTAFTSFISHSACL